MVDIIMRKAFGTWSPEMKAITSGVSVGYKYKKTVNLRRGKCLVEVRVWKKAYDYVHEDGNVFFVIDGYKPFTLQVDWYINRAFSKQDTGVLRSIMSREELELVEYTTFELKNNGLVNMWNAIDAEKRQREAMEKETAKIDEDNQSNAI